MKRGRARGSFFLQNHKFPFNFPIIAVSFHIVVGMALYSQFIMSTNPKIQSMVLGKYLKSITHSIYDLSCVGALYKLPASHITSRPRPANVKDKEGGRRGIARVPFIY